MIFNTTEGWQSLKDSKSIRAAALVGKIPIYTTATSSDAVMQAIAALRDETLEVRALQSYYKASQT
jgi:carbamoyl-phosphate synthase large subunit